MTDLADDLAALERSAPAVAAAARSYDLMVERVTGRPAPLDPIGESLLHVEVSIADLDQQLPRALESGQSPARLLAEVDAAWRRLGALRSELERQVAADLRPRSAHYDVDGVLVRIGGGRSRQWTDHRQLAWRIVEGGLADEDTGEMVEEKAAWRLLDRVLQALPAQPYWRVTALRDLGVDFVDLESWRDGRKTVTVLTAVGDA